MRRKPGRLGSLLVLKTERRDDGCVFMVLSELKMSNRRILFKYMEYEKIKEI
jgi:hypothetical protein